MSTQVSRTSAPFSPPSAPPRFRGAPAQLSSFVGREREIDLVRRLLSSARLLTLTGAGGSGKTRLGVEIVAREAAAGADGLWVELAPVRDESLVADAVLQAFDVREPADGQTAIERLTDVIGDRRLLLVLDNCEHLVDACAALADSLLRACPGLRILATSREALGVTAETAWLVPPLTVPALDGPADPSEACQLFVERAQAVHPGFELTDDNRAAVANIARRLDGLPLALELAAARLRVLTPDQIADRLDDRFKLLKTGNRSALPRHQTLRAAIDWSYELLDPNERLLLARLAVFCGGFTLEAAEAVCAGDEIDPDDVLDLVSELVEKSLVEMRETGDSARYRLLETVRQYGADRLDERGETAARQRRHAEFFFALALEAEANLLTVKRPTWVDRLSAEIDNLRQTLSWSKESDHELHMRLVGALHWFWFATGQWPEARSWLRSALLTPISDRKTRDRAAVLFSAGCIAALQARAESSRVHLAEAEEIAATLDDGRLEAYILTYHGMALMQQESPEALPKFLKAQAWFREHNDLYGLRLNLLLCATVHLVQGDFAKAMECSEDSVRVARVFGLDRELAIALQSLGLIVLGQGDVRRAASLFLESLEAIQRDPHMLFVARSFEMLASCLVEQQAFAEAATLFGASESVREAIGAKMWRVDRGQHERRIEAARRALGDAAFEAALAVGRATPVSDAVEFALETARSRATIDTADPSTNTSEFEVVRITPAVPALRVSALGALDVQVSGCSIAQRAWGYAKSRELLLFLLMHREGRTREQVGAALWPDASPAQVRNNFHVALHHLRKALGGSEWVQFDRERYRVCGAEIDIDAVRFEEEVSRALRKAKRGEVPVDDLATAIALYRGDFMDGEQAGDWHLEFRDRLSRLHAEALEVLGVALLNAGRFEQASNLFERLIRQEPLHEDAYSALMLCRARAGDRTAAMREYRRLEAVLRRELDSSPGKNASDLFRKLQRGEAV